MGNDLCSCIINPKTNKTFINVENQENIINENITTLNNNTNNQNIINNICLNLPQNDLNMSILNDKFKNEKNNFYTIIPFSYNTNKQKNLSIIPENNLNFSEIYKNNTLHSLFHKKKFVTIKRTNSGFLTRTKIYLALFGYDNCGKNSFFNIISEKKIYVFNKKKYEIIIKIFPYNKDNNYNIEQKFDFYLIMYDIGDIDSFNAVKNILKIKDISTKISRNIFIIANKSDLYDKNKYFMPDNLNDNRSYKSFIISVKTEKNYYINILNSIFEIFEDCNC